MKEKSVKIMYRIYTSLAMAATEAAAVATEVTVTIDTYGVDLQMTSVLLAKCVHTHTRTHTKYMRLCSFMRKNKHQFVHSDCCHCGC